MRPLHLAILISGRGSNMQTLLRVAEAPDFPARPVLVVSNRPGAPGLEAAAAAGIATTCIDHTAFGGDREAFERALDATLRKANVEIIALAGFMRVLTPWFVKAWAGRMVNIHPSLLPKYPGLKTHERAIAAGDTHAGCSVHWVTEGADEGDVIAQARVSIKPDDTPETLAARVLVAEHELYPRALAEACRMITQQTQKSPQP